MAKRKLYAEEIATGMQLACEGVKAKTIAVHFGVSVSHWNGSKRAAAQHGFAKFPLRESAAIFPIHPQWRIQGAAAGAFLSTL